MVFLVRNAVLRFDVFEDVGYVQCFFARVGKGIGLLCWL